METLKIKDVEFVVEPKPNWMDWDSHLSSSFSVFLHSANYKFSLGSGSSFMVKQLIDKEKELHGSSKLEKQIQRIRKTPICGVELTGGGDLPHIFNFEKGNRTAPYPNFNKIVHCVLPGPRIENFQDKIREMLGEVFSVAAHEYKKQDLNLFFVLPIIGINNFGYPVDFMLGLYADLLKEWIENNNISGTIVLWIKAELKDAIISQLSD